VRKLLPVLQFSPTRGTAALSSAEPAPSRMTAAFMHTFSAYQRSRPFVPKQYHSPASSFLIPIVRTRNANQRQFRLRPLSVHPASIPATKRSNIAAIMFRKNQTASNVYRPVPHRARSGLICSVLHRHYTCSLICHTPDCFYGSKCR
jgi:hypothetical protein